jgi:arabinose-5-phosphate isomerase
MDFIKKAKYLMVKEAQAIEYVAGMLDPECSKLIKHILNIEGKVIISGVGKSGIIAKKISATMASTGTPSIFIHPTEALHGDLGVVSRNDCVIMLSKSGESEELLAMIPSLRVIGCTICLICFRQDSAISRLVDITVCLSDVLELDINNIVPTASTTVMLSFGDAIATILMEERKFSEKEFAVYHPAGSLGKKLIVKVKDIMLNEDAIPLVSSSATVSDAILEISEKGLGATLIISDNNLIGIITDGDIRRLLQKANDVWGINVSEAMSSSPITINQEMLAIDALKLMEKRKVTVLPVVDNNKISGIIQLHQIIKDGVYI